jgi:hypothetical protein
MPCTTNGFTRFHSILSAEARVTRTALVDLILGDEAHAGRAAARLTADRLWPLAVALSGRWRLTPVLRARTRAFVPALDMRPDKASLLRMDEMTLAASAHSALAVSRSREGLAVLADAGIEAVAIKGVALIAGLYGHRSIRMVGDLDVVVNEDAFPAACAALAEAGYIDENPPLDRHLSDISLSPRLHNVARNLTRDGFEIDVHGKFGPSPPPSFRTDGVIRRAQTATLAGRPIRIAAPADAMAISAQHSLRGYFAPHESVKDSYDLAAWWSLRPDAWQLDEVVRTALEAELATALCALWSIVLRRDPTHPLGSGVAALSGRLSRRQVREAEALSAFCEDQFVHGMRAERTVQMFDVGRLCRSFVGLTTRKLPVLEPAGDEAWPARRPLVRRVAGGAVRIGRVLRELTLWRAFGSYRAVARAQSRHH